MSDGRSLIKIEEPERGHRLHLHPEDVIPHRAVEVVSEEEKRHEEQVQHRADPPKEFFQRVAVVEPPLVPGAAVSCETLLGFLAAIEKILPPEDNYPILTSAKLHYEPSTQELFVEAGSHAVWTIVALKVRSGAPKGFTAMLPVRRARNVLAALRESHPDVVVGVDEHGICLGPHTVPFGGMLDDFPERPVVGDWAARAAMPAFYFREVCSRVLTARSAEFKDIALQGALLDFEWHEFDGTSKPVCTAVATDGARIHILRLPQMVIEVKPTHIRALPPTCTVSAGFFHYMREIVQHEWAALEFHNDQIVAKGEDFVVVAKASPEGKSQLVELSNWRKINVDWPGYWLASSVKLLQIVEAAKVSGATDCRLEIDGRKEQLTISSTHAGQSFTDTISVRPFDGAAHVDVTLSIGYLLDALRAALGGLVRLAFNHKIEKQTESPVVIRGEDEQFKAIIMPIVGE